MNEAGAEEPRPPTSTQAKLRQKAQLTLPDPIQAAVLKQQAGPELLETYTTERAPVAELIVKRANKSSREFGQFFEVLGLMEAETEEEMRQQMEERKASTVRGRAKREALVTAMELKDYEFNAHGATLDSSMSQSRSFRMDLKGLSQRGTLSFTTKASTVPGLAPAARVARRRYAQGLHLDLPLTSRSR